MVPAPSTPIFFISPMKWPKLWSLLEAHDVRLVFTARNQ